MRDRGYIISASVPLFEHLDRGIVAVEFFFPFHLLLPVSYLLLYASGRLSGQTVGLVGGTH